MLATTREAAARAGVSKSHLEKLRLYKPAESPPFLRIGKRVVYPLSGPNSLETWINDRVAAARDGR